MCGYAHYSAPGGGREERVLVADEEEVCLFLVKGVGEVVRLRAHDVLRQAERVREPLQWDILTVRDVALLEGDLDLQDLRVRGQNIPGSVDLQEICFLVFRFLDRERKVFLLTSPSDSPTMGHPFKTIFCRLHCTSERHPVGGAVAPWLGFLPTCLPSPAPVLFSQGWPRTPSSSPGGEHVHRCQI